MATKNKTTQRGKYLKKVGFLDIYQKIEKNKPTEMRIFHGKKQLFKEVCSHQKAIEKANELMEGLK